MTIRGTNGYFGRAKYLAHLRTLDAGEIVGVNNTCYDCPIAREIKRLIPNAQDVFVSDEVIRYNQYVPWRGYLAYDRHEHRPPQWVKDFINEVDTDHWSKTPIAAEEAIQAMERIAS